MRTHTTGLCLLMILASFAGTARAQGELGYPRTVSARDTTLKVNTYLPTDEFVCRHEVHQVPRGAALFASWYGPDDRFINTFKCTYDGKTLVYFARLKPPAGGWPPGQYRVELGINGRVSVQWRFNVASAEGQEQQGVSGIPAPQGGQVPFAGVWMSRVTEGNETFIVRMEMNGNGSWTSTRDGRSRNSGYTRVSGTRFTNTQNNRTSSGQYSLSRDGTQLQFQLDGARETSVWYREGTANALALEGAARPVTGTRPQTRPPAGPTPPPAAVPTPAAESVSSRVLELRMGRRFDPERGIGDATTTFDAYDNLVCAFKARLRKGTEVVALWKNPQGATFRRVSYVATRDESSGTHGFLLKPDNGPWTAGKYTVQLVVNGEPQESTDFTVTAAVASGRPAKPPATSAPRADEQRDLVATKIPETSAAIAKARKGRRFALLIGVGRYDSAEVRALRFTNEDVEAVRAVLADPHLGNVPAENIRILSDSSTRASLESVGKALNWLAAMADRPEDTVIIYFSGHGYNDANGSYLATADTDPQTLLYTALNVSTFNKAVESIAARKKIIILDACHAGGMSIAARGDGRMTPQMYRELHAQTQGEVRLLSCDQDQSSYEEASFGHGVFSYFLVNGMRGEADANRDGIVTFGELEDFVKDRVHRHAAERGRMQTPRADSKVTGVIIMTDKGRQ